jgi:uncharacterized protein YceH (UPF0502 family)
MTTDSPVTLSAVEARVLGCLIEKAATTPEAYPLTLNSLHLACNQKTSRDPVMRIEPGEVGHALHTLQEKNLVRREHGARVERYEHTADAGLNVTPRARAIIALLLLRGAQTLGELFSRSERLADFPDTGSVGDTLERLIARGPALVVRLHRGAGQREDRYMHLLCGPLGADSLAPRTAPPPRAPSPLEARVAALEWDVAELKRMLQARDETQG